MGQSEDGEDAKRYEELCLDLNMDRDAKEDAWEAFQRIQENYSLEVGCSHLGAHFSENGSVD